MSGAQYFSRTLEEARGRLCDAGRKRGRVTRRWARDATVFQDVVELGPPNAPRCVVLVGGVHGVEGFAASAVQLSVIDEPLPEERDTKIVAIHGVNAYGMGSLRRVNADNVDLNRNARTAFVGGGDAASAYVYSVLTRFHARAPHLLAPEIALGVLRYGYRAFANAIAGGQTDYPRSLFFAGGALQPEVMLLLGLLEEAVDGAEKVRVIDLHSGVGNRPHMQFHGDRARYDAAKRTLGTALRQDHGSDLFAVVGGILDHLSARFRDRDLECFTYESGTVGTYRLLQALRRENFFHHRDPGGASDRTGKQALLEAFVPGAASWRDEYVQAAREMCRRCLGTMRGDGRPS